MKNLNSKIVLTVLSLLFIHISYSQKNSKKAIENTLNEAGKAFYDIDVDRSLRLSKKALNEAHLLKDDLLMAKAYNIIGLNFEEFYDINKGLKFYNYAIKYANLANNDSVRDWVYNNIGNIYSYKVNDVKKGIYYYEKGLYFAKKINDPIDVMYTKLNICSAYFAIKEFDKGLPFLTDCEEFILKGDELEAKMSLYNLYGAYHSYYNQNDKAEQAFKTAISFGFKSKTKLLDSNLCEIYSDFSDFYKKNKNYEKAFYYLNLYKDLKDQVYNEDRAKKVKHAGGEIEIQEYQRQIQKIESENEKQSKDLEKSKSMIFFFVFISFVLVLMLYFLFKNIKLRDRANRELKLANEAMKKAKEKAEEASQMKTQFVSTISHELRTPLYGVIGLTDIIIEEHKELATDTHLSSLKFSAQYLLSLVNDLLQINKIEENKLVLERMTFSLSKEINHIVDSLKFIALRNNNQLVCEIDEKISDYLIGDKLALSQILINLISNALKFTKSGQVKIIALLKSSELNKNIIEFKVEDTGVGIAKEDQEKIFDKFVQIQRKDGDYQGTGLGLSIVQKLVELFGGSIKLQSELGVGTTFSFVIGFDVDTTLAKESKTIEESQSNNPEKEYRVLVVDDNKINQIVTRKILENNHINCVAVDNGYTAIDVLDMDTFDIILMDINMPIINGFDTTKLIRERKINTPIIALTAFVDEDVKIQAFKAGMNDILVKPFEESQLIELIKKRGG